MGGSDARFGVRTVLALMSLTLVAIPFGLVLFLVQDKWSPLLSADNGLRDGLHRFTTEHPWFAGVMRFLSTVGSAPVYFVVFAVVTGWLLYRRLPRLAAFAVVAEVGGAVLNQVVKTLVHRARPIVVDPVAHFSGMSFPSGHAQSAVVSYSFLLLVFLPAMSISWRRIAAGVAVVMVLGIGVSRVALSAHYASDVLAGYILGAAWVIAMTATFSAWRRERGRNGVRPSEGLAPEDAARLTPAALPEPRPAADRESAADATRPGSGDSRQ
ncbi:phosphatase PAP2 family protein [Actinokineospora auranticolor]|nr:phosphatase PAP2 family protein [Actinokineospora auranticolor]